MSKKRIVAACVATCVFGVSLGWMGRGIYEKFVHIDLYSKIVGIETVLKDSFLYEYDEKELADYAALGMSAALNDPYTVYYNREQFESYLDDGQGDFVGIGITVVYDKDNDEIDIISVSEDSPAMRAGVLPGDVLVAVDGERFTGAQMNDAVAKVKGIGQDTSVEDTDVVVSLRRDGNEFDTTLTRERIHQSTVKYEMIDNSIGYIRITAFNRSSKESHRPSTYEEFTNALFSLSQSGVKKLIFDVRDNGGGDADVVSDIVDRLVPKGLIMYTVDKYEKRDEVHSGKSELDIPMAVLVNGNTASAAELFTGALMDYDKAVVVGTQTFGKGVMQRIFPFSDGSGMSVTIAKYYTPNGTCVQDAGLTPDIVVEPLDSVADKPVSLIDPSEDTQLQTAIDYLRNN